MWNPEKTLNGKTIVQMEREKQESELRKKMNDPMKINENLISIESQAILSTQSR